MIKTKFSVPQSPDQVWSVLMDFPSWPRWNTYLGKIVGEPVVGRLLTVTTYPETGERERSMKEKLTLMSKKASTFSPRVKVVHPGRELRWRGEAKPQWILTGEHYWVLAPTASGGTDVEHGERFRGLLKVILPSMDIYQGDFERMNRDMTEELARRYPASARPKIFNSTNLNPGGSTS